MQFESIKYINQNCYYNGYFPFPVITASIIGITFSLNYVKRTIEHLPKHVQSVSLTTRLLVGRPVLIVKKL